MDFWLDIGVDGFRLDAVPYLIEREGTSCENLPETYDVVRVIRRHLDTHHSNRVLLAEANQPPAQVRAYLGDGDMCHMAFHFPLMTRLFIGLHLEERHPITDIMDETPAIPDTCQWALFLRNHDELTLEMVTDAERDYMYLAVQPGSTRPAQCRHPPPAGAAHGQRPPADRAAHQRPVFLSRHPDRLLRRRNRHGRRCPAWRSRRRPDPDAMDRRSECRLLERKSRGTLQPGDHRSGVRLPGGERRVSAARSLVAVPLDED